MENVLNLRVLFLLQWRNIWPDTEKTRQMILHVSSLLALDTARTTKQSCQIGQSRFILINLKPVQFNRNQPKLDCN